jgi:hypothetical protein
MELLALMLEVEVVENIKEVLLFLAALVAAEMVHLKLEPQELLILVAVVVDLVVEIHQHLELALVVVQVSSSLLILDDKYSKTVDNG